jgi:hypothetical protein
MAVIKRFRGLPLWLQIVIVAVVFLGVFAKVGLIQRLAHRGGDTEEN